MGGLYSARPSCRAEFEDSWEADIYYTKNDFIAKAWVQLKSSQFKTG